MFMRAQNSRTIYLNFPQSDDVSVNVQNIKGSPREVPIIIIIIYLFQACLNPNYASPPSRPSTVLLSPNVLRGRGRGEDEVRGQPGSKCGGGGGGERGGGTGRGGRGGRGVPTAGIPIHIGRPPRLVNL